LIELGSLALMAALGGVLAVPTVVVQYKIRGWLGRRRNKRGLCCRCREALYRDGSAPSRVGGVLYCDACTGKVRLAWTAALWTAAGLALALPVVGVLGMAGLLPFITGGVTAGAVAGLIVPPLVLAGAIKFELSHSREANARREIAEGVHGVPAGSGGQRLVE
jgi:hypothetical protein